MSRKVAVAFGIAVLVALAVGDLSAQRKRKYEEPKPQILPLPPGLPMALAADTGSLDFHISPLLKTGGLSAQIRRSLTDLIRDTHGETIVKLRAFVAGAGDARRVEAEAAAIFSERKLPLPVLTILQVGGLEDTAAQVVIEAVVSTPRTANPNGLAFIAGQQSATLREAFEKMKHAASAATVEPDRLLRMTCFTSRIEDYEATRASVLKNFPNVAFNLVQAVRDPRGEISMCEAVGQLSEAPARGEVVWLKGARATLVNSRQLVFTGLQLTFGSFLDDAHEAFLRLHRAASALQPVEVPVQVNAFSLNMYAGSALVKTTSFPQSTFTVQAVEGLPAIDASAGIEAILAPGVQAPVTAPE
jgi:enamine deaminase RidA (YjgF/YER057c/UK114 family)